MPYDGENTTKLTPEALQKSFEDFQKRHGVKPLPLKNPPLESGVMKNVERLRAVEMLQAELENPEAEPSDLDQLYRLAIVQLEKLLQTDIAWNDPKASVHARNLNASINILLTFLSRQKKPPIDRLPELLKLINENEAELKSRFGVQFAAA